MKQWTNYHFLCQTALCQVKYFKTLPDTKCHNWCKFKWPRLRSHCILGFCQKYCSPYRLGVKKKLISVDAEEPKSREYPSCLHGRRLKCCERCHKDSHFHTHASADVLPGGKACESGCWTVDSVPSPPRWDKTQRVTPSWSQHRLNLILGCLAQTSGF